MYLCVAEAEDGRGVKCLVCRTQENRMVVSKCSRHNIIPRQFRWGWLHKKIGHESMVRRPFIEGGNQSNIIFFAGATRGVENLLGLVSDN